MNHAGFFLLAQQQLGDEEGAEGEEDGVLPVAGMWLVNTMRKATQRSTSSSGR
jgi:hypothetical protein